MTSFTASTPGLYFSVVPRPTEASPLRTDVAGFAGRTRRGVVGRPVRVEEWRGYLREFGGLLADSSTTYALRGYFENGGQVAYVVRLCAGAEAANSVWKVGELKAGVWTDDSPATFPYGEYRIEASSPGAWGNEIIVRLRYRLRGPSGEPEIDVNVRAEGETTEYLTGIPVDAIETTVAARSLLIRIRPDLQTRNEDIKKSGPNHDEWEFKLTNGSETNDLSTQDYLDAIGKLGGEARQETGTSESLTEPSLEVALVAVPGLHEDLRSQEQTREVLVALLDQAERLHDRLAIVDLPTEQNFADESGLVDNAVEWMEGIKNSEIRDALRAAAIYHPSLRVSDPLGGVANPIRCVPPSGHVAGLISRLDRERGAHHTPANATLLEAVDITRGYDTRKQAQLQESGINLIRCFPGRGLVVWGGRTAAYTTQERIFIAHRRLIHRLVRAIRRVAEPLVFDINGPELRLTIVRGVTTVLLEAWRAGALKGQRPEEAFRVSCDEKTTPPEEQDLGRVICEIEVAPAVPMEFILLRVALGGEAVLEVFES